MPFVCWAPQVRSSIPLLVSRVSTSHAAQAVPPLLSFDRTIASIMGAPRDELRTSGGFDGESPPGRNWSGIVAPDRRNWLRAAPAGCVITGSKIARRTRAQTRIRHCIAPRPRFRLRHSELPAQNVWKPLLGHQIHPNSHASRSSSSDGNIVRKPRPNCSVSVNPQMSASKDRFIPAVSHRPPPVSAGLFKEYSVLGHGGLMSDKVSKLTNKGEFVVFNSLTGETKTLPPLLHPRNPVLVHISVDSDKKSFNVIVAGSSAAGDEHLSRRVEVFDSSTSKWEEVWGLPGPAFRLNEYQAGVCLNEYQAGVCLNEYQAGVCLNEYQAGECLNEYQAGVCLNEYQAGVCLNEYQAGVCLNEYQAGVCLNEYQAGVCLNEYQAGVCLNEYQAGVCLNEYQAGECLNEYQAGVCLNEYQAGVCLNEYQAGVCLNEYQAGVCLNEYQAGVCLNEYQAGVCLNEYQAGVCLNGKLFFTSFLESGGRGVVALDVANGTWLPDLATPIPRSSSNNLLLVVSDGSLFLFSEQESDQSVDHCIDDLEFQNPKAGTMTCRWRPFVKEKNSGGRGLLVFPQFTGQGKLGIVGKNLRNILLAFLSFAFWPTGARAEDQIIQDLLCSNSIPSTAWGSLDVAKAVAGTVFAGTMMIGAARFAWGVFRNRFNIDGGLKKETLNPRSREAEREIPPAIPA